MSKPTRYSIIKGLFTAYLSTAIFQSFAVVLAKAYNNAFSQTVTHDLACTEQPAHPSLSSLGTQSLINLLAMFVTFHIFVNASILEDSAVYIGVKFIFGEILGWAFKELTVIFYVYIATSFPGVVIEEEERRLGDYLQGDADFAKEEAWLFTAAYAIMFTILSVVVLSIFFGPGLKLFEKLTWRLSILIYRAPWNLAKLQKKRMMEKELKGDEGEDEEEKAEEEENKEESEDPTKPFSREESDDLAYEFTNECIRVSYAYCANGLVTGIGTSAFSNDYEGAEVVVRSSYGLLEFYCIMICVVAGLLVRKDDLMRSRRGKSRIVIVDFFIEFFATWAGLAIASLATSPGAASASLENADDLSETAIDIIRVILTSCFAVYLLLQSSVIQVNRSLLCNTIKIDDIFAVEFTNILRTAAVVGFAVSWEEFGGDFACKFAKDDDEEFGLSPNAVLWIYFAIIFVVFTPFILMLGKIQKEKNEKAAEHLTVYLSEHGKHRENSILQPK